MFEQKVFDKKESNLNIFQKEQQIMKDSYIQIRISTKEKTNLENYAKEKGESLTNFLLTAARERIELEDRLRSIENKLDNIEKLLEK